MNYKDFLVIIAPPECVANQILLLKKACAKHIGMFESMHSKAHISFGLFGEEIETPRQKTFAMESFFNLVASDISIIEPIELKINGFSFFNHGKNFKTIYASFELTDEIMEWFNNIKKILKIDSKLTPHITIAKKIPIDAFNKLWPHFEEIKFKSSFVVDYLTILTRENSIKPTNYVLFKK